MPQAGWCRECGEWVWVDPEGACQNGHGPECVGGVYDAEERLPGIEVTVPDFGVGELPADLNTFNWGAFLLPLPWGIVFGAWSVVMLWMLTAMVPLVFVVLVGSFGDAVLARNMIGVSIASQAVAAGIRLWIGANATRLLWVREHQRLEVIDNSKPRFSIVKYLAQQKMWARVGIWFTVFALAGLVLLVFSSDPQVLAMMKKQGVTPQDAGLSAFWLVAQAGLGVWLAGKMRQESTTPHPPSPEV